MPGITGIIAKHNTGEEVNKLNSNIKIIFN